MLAALIRYEVTIRFAAALLVLTGGVIHLLLDTDWPNDNVERMWLLNFAASAGVAIALAVWKHWIPVLAGLAVVDSTLLAFGLSRTDSGVPFTSFGGANFTERGWQPSPEAAMSVVVEVTAALLLLALLPVRLGTALAPRSQPGVGLTGSTPPS